MADSPQKKPRPKDLVIFLGVLLTFAVIIGILVQGFLSAD